MFDGAQIRKLLACAVSGESIAVVQCNDKKFADLIKCLEPNRRVEVQQSVIERRVPQVLNASQHGS